MKKFKKLLAILLALLMVLSLAACSGGDDEQTDEPGGEQTDDENGGDTSEPKYKIGYTFPDGATAGLAGDAAAALKLAAEALNIEILFGASQDLSAEGTITTVENFIAAGCDAVICCNFSESSMVQISKLCDDAGVYFAQFYRTLSDEDVIATVEASDYYVGRVHEDEYGTAYALAEAMIDAGCQNLAMLSSVHGDNTYETRASGYRDACAEHGVNIIIEEWDQTTDTVTNTTTNILAAYPEVDGFLLINCSFAPYVLAAMENTGTILPMCGVDFDTTLLEMIENETITAIAGGHHNDPLFALLLVYNALEGAFDSSEYPIDVLNNMITISSVEEYEDYATYFANGLNDPENGQAYNKEEIQQMTITYNPDFTVQDILDAASSISIADVMERHAAE